MLLKLIKQLNGLSHFESANAHCDIPCGIYDPHLAQIGTLTVIRMIDLIGHHVNEAGKIGYREFYYSISRYIAVKEDHAELTKHEIRIIWGDFIKAVHIE